MFNPITALPLVPVLAALPLGSIALESVRRPLYAVPVDGGWTAYTPEGEGFRPYGELVYASLARLAMVMASY